MGVKLYADTAQKKLIITASPVDGIVELNVQEEVWSDLIIDWEATLGLRKHTFPVVAIGGQEIAAGKLGTTYLLLDPWQIDPNLSADIEVGTTAVGNLPIYGPGTDEGLAQSGAMPYPGNIPNVHLRAKRVGTPTDSLRVSIDSSLGGTRLQTTTVDGDLLPATLPAGHGYYVGFEAPADLPAGTPLYFVVERTGSRDLTNYYEVCYDNDVFGGPTYSLWTADTSVWTADTAKDLCLHIHTAIPYQLSVFGNLFPEVAGVQLVIPTSNVSVQQYLSTLVEVMETSTSGLTAAESAALELIRKFLTNKLVTDPDAGKMTVYDDDDTTPAYEGDIYEKVDGSQKYRGRGIERRDRLT